MHSTRTILGASLALALGAAPLPAIVDRNGDGLSDVWAALYHPTKGATVDEDGDGFTNAQEALAGTDPLDPASCFAAVLRADATGALVLRWHGLRGKRYTIESSTDLRTWVVQPGVHLGAGVGYGVVVQEVGAPTARQRHWRVVVADADSDGDGVTNWEAQELGLDTVPDPIKDPVERTETPLPRVYGAEYFVSPDGSDANAGTKTAPFRTLDKAQIVVRTRIGAGVPAGGIAVWLRGGVYPRTATLYLGGNDSSPDPERTIDWRGWPGEEVRISGGVALEPRAFRAVSDPAVAARLDPAVRARVLEADLSAAGLPELGEFPVRFRGRPAVPELFCDDVPMTLARWPNEEWATIGEIVAPGTEPVNDADLATGGVFLAREDRASRWNLAEGVWLHGFWGNDWFDTGVRLGAYDPAQRRITLAAGVRYTVTAGGVPARRYYALNVLEELDHPGEYYIDRRRRRLYFLPPGDLAGARLVLSGLNGTLFSLVGTTNIRIRDLVFEAGLTNGVDVTDRVVDGVVERAGSGVAILGCTARNLRWHGLFVSGGSGHRVERCDVYDVGVGGITLAGGHRPTLTAGGHRAVNNRIRRFGRLQLSAAPGLKLGGVGNLAAHNLVSHGPHTAIEVDGNDHQVEYNEIHHVNLETDDCGALYKGRNPSKRGNRIERNFWHHIGTPMGWGVAAVYFDDGDGGDFVVGNVFYRAGHPNDRRFGVVFSHGGHGLLAENNIFVASRRALGSSQWSDARWLAMLADGDWQRKLLEEVDITGPTFTDRYPELIGFMTPAPGAPRVSTDRRNLVVGAELANTGNWVADGSGWATAADPGFVDAAAGDFRLPRESEVYARIPGFKVIPFEYLGLTRDGLRFEVPVEPWVD